MEARINKYFTVGIVWKDPGYSFLYLYLGDQLFRVSMY